jgi:hypothetical protein
MGSVKRISLKQTLYKTPDEVFHSLQGDERDVAEILRDIVLTCIPGCQEKLSFGAPFYYKNSRICYIWPGSIPWGQMIVDGVQFGFCKGYLLEDTSWLEKQGRKEVYTIRYNHPSEIDADLLKAGIFDAIKIDELKRKASIHSQNFSSGLSAH